MPVETEFAWAAGFLDGEGYFGASKGNGLGKRSYRLTIRASQAGRRAPCDRLQNLFGGVVHELSLKNSGTRATAPAFRWTVDGAPSVMRVVPFLLPHLVVKWAEAALLLEIAELIRPRGMPGRGYPTQTIARMDALAGQIQTIRRMLA